jgi:threonine/homoserine/homoserine lactone efflux protein
MIDAIAQFGIGFVIALSGIMIPGPLLAYVLLKTPSSGTKTGPRVVLGHILVELFIISLIALGLSYFIKSQTFQIAVGMVGGTALLIFGSLYLTKLTEPWTIDPNLPGLKYSPTIGGILFSTVLNPSVILWWGTVGLTTLTNAFLVAGVAGAAFWLAGHFSADLVWYSLISYFLVKGKHIFGGRAYHALLAICGCLLLVFGGYFIWGAL